MYVCMARGQRTQTGNTKNGVDISYEEMYTFGNRHRDMRHHFDYEEVENYLPIRLYPRLTFWAQIRNTSTKAANVTSLLSGLMANLGGPTQSKRRLIMAITDSMLLYSSDVWADALKVYRRIRILSSVQ